MGPEVLAFLDYETRSHADIRQVGGRLYASDPTTEILMGAVLLGDTLHLWSPWAGLIGDYSVPVEILRRLQIAAVDFAPATTKRPQWDCPTVAHNAEGFDRHIGEREGIETTWIDALPRFRRRSLPGKLDAIGEALYGVGKDPQGERLIRLLSKPRRGSFAKPTRASMTALARYCARDVLLMAAAWEDEGLGEPHVDDATLEVDQVINARGVRIDIAAAEGIKDAVTKADEAAVAASPVATSVLSSPQQMRAWLASRGVDVPDCRAATLRAVEAEGEVAAAIAARLAIKRVTAGKISQLLAKTSPDGRLRGILAYYGAHTGRWAGRGFQPQNLPRPPRAIPDEVWEQPELALALPDTAAFLGGMLRGIVVGDPALLIADYSGVETAGLAWLAGEERTLDWLRGGGDAYIPTAAKIFGVDPGEVTKAQRQIAKPVVLGCGYQGGVGALENYASGMGISLDGLNPQQLVEAYRDAHPAIAGERSGELWEGRVAIRRGGFWRELGAAVNDAVRYSRSGSVGKIGVERHGAHVVLTLPSSRELIYRRARIEVRETTFGAQECVVYDHPRGATITQAVCRDLLAAALVRVEAAGLNPVLHVHDEIVCEAPPERYAELVECMTALPDWAAGFPVGVEGHVAKRYGK